MRDKRKYEELFPEEFMEIMAQRPICYWACGPMEYHGLQNTLGIDPAKAYEICLRAAKISGGIVFPMVPFAPGGAPPSLKRAQLRPLNPSLSPSLMTCVDTCERLYVELFESLADMGFKVCLAFGGHGPAGALLKKIECALDGRMDNMLFATYTSTTFIDQAVYALGAKMFGHGGMWETSMNMAVNPAFVDLSRTDGPAGGWPAYPGFEKYPDELREAVMHSNLPFGNQLIDVSARAMAEIASTLLQTGKLTHPGNVIAMRIGPARELSGALSGLPCPDPAETAAYPERIFRKTLCSLPEFKNLFQGRPLFAILAFDLEGGHAPDRTLGFDYDAPIKVWIDGQTCLVDEAGTPPMSARNGRPKKSVSIPPAGGRQSVTVALVSRQGAPPNIRIWLPGWDHV